MGLACDNEVEFIITSSTDTVKKVRKVLFGVEVSIGKSMVKILAIVLQGLHFDMLLGVSWFREEIDKFLEGDGAIKVNSERLNYIS